MTRRRTMRSRRGAAMIEALIALPVLTALLVAVPWLHELIAARQRAFATARHCGFAYALTGCSELPTACATPPDRGAAPAPDAQSDVVGHVQDGAGAGALDDVPMLGAALAALLGDTIEARATAAVRPRAGLPPRVAGAVLLVCNERPRDVLAIARDMFCRHLPLLDCGGGG